jgi:hypothetical protein
MPVAQAALAVFEKGSPRAGIALDIVHHALLA